MGNHRSRFLFRKLRYKHFYGHRKNLGLVASQNQPGKTRFVHILDPKIQGTSLAKTLPELASVTKTTEGFLGQVINRSVDPYVQFGIKKRNPRQSRPISSPLPPLRKTQKYILRNLNHDLVHPAAHAYVPKRSIITAATPHLGMTWGVKVDIKSFFTSISEDHVTYALLNAGVSRKMAKNYAALITRQPSQWQSWIPPRYKRPWAQSSSRGNATISGTLFRSTKKRQQATTGMGHLPQGSPTSGAISNLVLWEFDEQLAQYCRETGFVFTRYSDDIVLSTTTENFTREFALKVISEIRRIANSQGFSLNGSKTKILTPGSRKFMLGVLVDGPTLRLPLKTKETLRAAIRDMHVFGLENQEERAEQGLPVRLVSAPGRSAKESPYFHRFRGWLYWVLSVEPAFLDILYADALNKSKIHEDWEVVLACLKETALRGSAPATE